MANKKAEILTMDGQVVSPITLATNVLLDDGHTAQDLLDSRDESMFSPTITTSSSISKVGQGDNVDFSENIIDGAYKSCVLKGKTLVNHNAEGNNRNEYACMPSLEGSNLTVNGTVESKVKSAILKGQTLVNKLPKNKKELSVKNGEDAWVELVALQDPIPSGKYLLKCNYDETPNKTGTRELYFITTENTNIFAGVRLEKGINNYVITLDEDITKVYAQIVGHTQDSDVTISDVTLIPYQEGMENWDIPYFTGMQSVKMPVLTTTGKNLFNKETVSYNTIIDGKGNASTNANYVSSDFIRIKENTTYYTNGLTVVIGYDTNKQSLGYLRNYSFDGLFTTPANCNFVRIRNFSSLTDLEAQKTLIESVQFEQSSTSTPYEPYKSNILTTPSDLELRGIGDVKDELDLLNGELTQRVYNIVFNESFKDRSVSVQEFENVYRFGINVAHISNNLSNDHVMNSICDKFIIDTNYTGDYEHCYYWGSTFYFFISKNKIEGTIEAFKTYITNNPIIFQTILATPTVKTVDLSDNHVYSYKDTTHYTCSSEDVSLIPTLTIEEGVKYKAIIKPSTKYSIVFNRTEVASGLTVDLGGATANITSTTLGKNTVQIATPSTLSHNYVIFKGLGNVIKDVQVIEGDVVGDEPYFEGMCDSKSPILSNVGKNLVNVDNYVNYPSENIPIVKDGENSYIIENKKVGSWQNRCVDKIKLKANTTYTLSYDSEVLSASVPMIHGTVINLRDDSDTSINISGDASAGKPRTFTPTRDTLARLCMYATDTSGGINRIKFSNIQLEESSKRTEYEPYKSNILSCETYFDETTQSDKTIVLRSLPSGVCDTLNVETGEYVQRIGEREYQVGDESNSQVLTDRVNTQYELATPIITTIDLKQHPFAYKDGYVVLTSSSEEISLTPTIEYSLIANRLGQIQSNQKLVEKQQAKIDELESMVVANLVNTQYQQALNEIKLGVK